MNKIIVIGIAHHNTYGVIRALAQKGLKDKIILIIIGEKNNFVVQTSLVERDNIYHVHDNQAVYDLLLSSFADTEYKSTIICCSDSSIAYLDSKRDSLRDYFNLPNADDIEGRINQLMDKSLQREYARKCGLQLPEGKLICTFEDVRQWQTFPCIIKPQSSICGSKSDIHIYRTKEDLLKYFSDSDIKPTQIEAFINKKMEFQLIGCSLDSGETVIIPGYTDIIRQPDNTNTGFLEYKPLDNNVPGTTLSKTKKFLRNIGYSGLFSVEFIKGNDDHDYFMEINMRNDGNAICVTASGVNLPYIWYAHNSNIDIFEECTKSPRRVIVMPEFDDFVFVLKGKVSLWNWIKDVKRTDCFMEYESCDKAPFFYKLRDFLKFLLKRIFRI